jgi:hypothetical protein
MIRKSCRLSGKIMRRNKAIEASADTIWMELALAALRPPFGLSTGERNHAQCALAKPTNQR